MDEYLSCGNEQHCIRVAEVFELKSYTIKNITFLTLIEKICQKTEELKNKSKREIDGLVDTMKNMEKAESLRIEELKNKIKYLQSGENVLIMQLQNEITKHKDKVLNYGEIMNNS